MPPTWRPDPRLSHTWHHVHISINFPFGRFLNALFSRHTNAPAPPPYSSPRGDPSAPRAGPTEMRDGICPQRTAACRPARHTASHARRETSRSQLARSPPPQPDHAVSSTEGVSCAGNAGLSVSCFSLLLSNTGSAGFGKIRVFWASSASFPTRDQTEHHHAKHVAAVHHFAQWHGHGRD